MIRAYLEETLTTGQKEYIMWGSDTTESMLNQLDHSVIGNTFTIGLPYWSKQNPLLVKNFTYLMSYLNLGETKVLRNFAEFKFNMSVFTTQQILDYRAHGKLDQFLMRIDDNVYSDTLVKRNGKVCDDGLARPAFNKACKHRFMLDVTYIRKYKRAIKQNLIKSIKHAIEKGTITDKFFADEASYRIVAEYCLDNYMDPTAEYNSEYNVSDQRGRAIYNVLKRIGNYISNKDFRAMLAVPMKDAIVLTKSSTEAIDDIYYFIAELTGKKCLGGTEADKIAAGKAAYEARELPRLNLKSEEDRKDLHELIWLERIYAKLDKLMAKGIVRWDIPVEIDHSMSLAQIVGALTNDKRVLESTCVIGSKLSDPWYIDGVRRLTAKAVGTPT